MLNKLIKIFCDAYAKKATEVNVAVAMLRVMPYVYVVWANYLWATIGFWFAFGAGMIYVVAAISSGIMRPKLSTAASTLALSGGLSLLLSLSLPGIDSVSASVLVIAFMTADGISAMILMLSGRS